MIRIDEGAGWRDIPITSYDTNTFGENVATLGGLAAASARGAVAFFVAAPPVAAIQYRGFMQKDRDNAVYVTIFAYPTAYGANPSDYGTCWVGYTQETDELETETETVGAYTNHRDVTVYYCAEND